MNHWRGHFLNLLICPHCKGILLKYKDFLVCRFHKKGYRIFDESVDFCYDSAKTFELEEIKKMNS